MSWSMRRSHGGCSTVAKLDVAALIAACPTPENSVETSLIQDAARGSFGVSKDDYTPDSLARHEAHARERLEQIKAAVREEENRG